MTSRVRGALLAGYVVLAGAFAVRSDAPAVALDECYGSWLSCTEALSKSDCGVGAYCDNDHPGCSGWEFENC